MSTHVRSSVVTRTAYVAGVAAAGTAFWMAGTTGPDAAEPEVQLTSIGLTDAVPCGSGLPNGAVHQPDWLQHKSRRRQLRCSPR